MSPRHTVLDQRGYHFQMPMLGLPDRSGEWFMARMVIAPKDIDNPCYLFAGPMDAPVRYASADCGAFQAEYKGIVYIVPLVAPQKPYPATELFSIKVRRERVTSMPPSAARFKGGESFFMAHPKGMAGHHPKTQATPPTEAEEKVFWQRTLSSIFTAYTHSSKASVPMYGNMFTNGTPAETLAKLTPSQPENLLEWVVAPGEAFDKEWMKEVVDKAMRNAKHTKSPMHTKGPGIALKAVQDSGSEGVRFDYAVLCHDLEAPRWDEWSTLPPHAFQPGRKKSFTNQAKQVWAKSAGDEAQWGVYRVASSTAKGKKA